MSSNEDLEKAAEVIKKGGVIIFPTDTVYGIGCMFDNKRAIERIYKIKKTPKSQSFPILVSKIKQVEQLADIPDSSKTLIKNFWPGGLTIILKSTSSKPGLRSRENLGYKPGLKSRLGFRMPDSSLVAKLINKVGKPIIGTSANFHGQKAPKDFKELDPEIIKLADYVLRGKCSLMKESTVVEVSGGKICVLREGAVKLTT